MKKLNKYADILKKNAVEANDRVHIIPEIVGYEIMNATAILG